MFKIKGEIMTGMTGYAISENVLENNTKIIAEIKSVNHRFLDINIYIPSYLNYLEIDIRNLIKSNFTRGKIDVSVQLKIDEYINEVKPNLNLVQRYYESLSMIKSQLNIDEAIKLDHLLQFDDILLIEKSHDYNAFYDPVMSLLNKSVSEVKRMRHDEGNSTYENLSSIIKQIESDKNEISVFIPEMENEILLNIKKKMDDLVGDKVDNERILNEVGILVSKSSIAEEIQRLTFHIKHFLELADQQDDVGKRLDFICQEMHREINTIGSKSVFTKITKNVISIKNNIEKLREQLRNIG